ncbi:hypothetical protein [Roseococcus suduntuyensis]|uniref:Putative membrane protein n=1 Tax=Roseococcus suduntuyensis TaxID=455361 RepID=A0A840ACI3_9PROT|nr:hypothetical protein [Roseococcus suduntuyensis]MBB3899279.1 putative membrane protein [Roseococcus suduntuyensis]
MNGFLLGLMALGYSGLVLFWMAHSLKKLMRPMRAAIGAFALSCIVHSVTLLMLEPEHVSTALALWAVPHLLLLPALLWSAWKQEKEGRA